MKKFTLLFAMLIGIFSSTWANDTYYIKGAKVTTTDLEDGKNYIIEGKWKGQGPALLWYSARGTAGAMNERANLRMHTVSGSVSADHVWKAQKDGDWYKFQNLKETSYYIPKSQQQTWNNEAGQFQLQTIVNDKGSFAMKNSLGMVMHADSGEGINFAPGGIAISWWGPADDDSKYGTGSNSHIAIEIYEAEEYEYGIDRSSWKVTAYAGTTNGEGPMAALADGNRTTFFHSDWQGKSVISGQSGNNGKQAFMIEMAKEEMISSIAFYPRYNSNSGGVVGLPTSFRIYVSNTPIVDFSEMTNDNHNAKLSVETLGEAAFTGTWSTSYKIKTAEFTTPQTGKYILLVSDNENNYLMCSEFYAKTQNVIQTAEITYQIKDGENVLWEKNFEREIGTPYPECQVNPWVSVVAPEGTVSVSETKVVDYVSSIKTFDNVADVDQWYTLDLHGNESNYQVYNNEGNIRVVNNGSSTSYRSGEVNAKYAWAFIGNPVTGVRVYNNEAEKFVVQPSDGDVEIVFGDEGSLFQICSTTSGIANSFALKVDGRSYYINHRQPKIQGWVSADAGSSFRAWAVDLAQYADLTAMNAAIDKLNSKTIGIALGEYHETAEGAIAAALQAAAQFGETTPASEQAAVDAAAEALNNAAVINMPTAGSYIRFKGYSGNYIDGATTGQAKMVALEGNENTTIFLLNTESQIISVTTGTGFENTHTIIAESENTPHVFTITEGSVIGTYQIRSNYSGSQIWFDNTANGKKLDRNGSPATQTNWTIEAAPVAKMRITSAQWATFCAPFAVAIPEGVKAYTGEMQDGWIRMNELSNGIIPANTGVVINAEAEVETLLAEIPDNNETVENNCYKCNLTGRNMTVEVGDYLLQKNFDDEKKEDVVGWYKVSGEGFTLAPNRCYLSKDDVPAPNQSRTFFGFAPDDATGISSIATEAKTKADGKYMVNGQIVVVKAGKAYNMNGTEVK